MKEIIIHAGLSVACDFCSEDYTNSDTKGGLLYRSYALGPCCAKKVEKEPRQIKARCPEGMTFRDWVLSLRAGDNTVRVIYQ